MSTEDEARNLAPRRGAPAFWTYIAAIVIAGGCLLALQLSGMTMHEFRVMGASFVVVAGLLVLGELRPLVTAGSPDENGVSTSTAFVYALLHFSVWVVLDHFFDWGALAADIVKRPYITVGMAALVLLVPLAATSTTGMIKRLGGRNWRRLHALVYVIGVLATLHYFWLAKKVNTSPRWYAAVLILLLGIRLVDWARRRLAGQRRAVPAG